MICHAAFPHIFEAIIEDAPIDSKMVLRNTSKELRSLINLELYEHVLAFPNFDDADEFDNVNVAIMDEGSLRFLPRGHLHLVQVVDWNTYAGHVIAPALNPRVVRRTSSTLSKPFLGPKAHTYVDFVINMGYHDPF
jgi:hypothetical protein